MKFIFAFIVGRYFSQQGEPFPELFIPCLYLFLTLNNRLYSVGTKRKLQFSPRMEALVSGRRVVGSWFSSGLEGSLEGLYWSFWLPSIAGTPCCFAILGKGSRCSAIMVAASRVNSSDVTVAWKSTRMAFRIVPSTNKNRQKRRKPERMSVRYANNDKHSTCCVIKGGWFPGSQNSQLYDGGLVAGGVDSRFFGEI